VDACGSNLRFNLYCLAYSSSGQWPRYDVTVRCGSREAMSEVPRSYGNKSG
jgi:hypothetical protein